MITQIISNCGCCGLPCCIKGSGRIGTVSRSCYYATYQDFTYESLGLPTTTNNFKNCIKEEGFVYKWYLYLYNGGIGLPSYSGIIDEDGNLIGLPTSINLYCRYGAGAMLEVACEAATTTTTTTPCLDSWWSYQGVFSDGIFTGPDCVRCVCQPDAPNPGQTNSSGPYSDLASCEAFAKPINDLLTYPNGTPRCR